VIRSLRFRLAARAAGGMTTALVAISLIALAGAREFLDSEIEASLLNVASIQASALTDVPDGSMRFHEWDLTPEEAAQVRELNRYAQVWSASGESLLRTQYITTDLPLDSGALRETAAGRLVTADQQFQGMPIRSLYYPLERMGQAHARHVLQIAAPLGARDRMLRRLAWMLATITLAVGTATFAGGWWLGGRMVRPVDEIIDQAETMQAGTLGRRITAHVDIREYERLVDVLNRLLARLEDAFAVQRRFTADASHELRSPLTVLKGEIELALRRERDATEYRRVLSSNLQEVDRLARIAEELLTLARSDSGVLEPRYQATDAAARTQAIVDRLRPDADDKNIALHMRADRAVRAVLDPALFDQLVWNLVENAVKFTPADGRVDVAVTSDAHEVVLEVRDNGPGIPADAVERIFERFYRVDAARTNTLGASGTGLGLAIVRAIAEIHGGTARAANVPEGGALLRVSLPANPEHGPTPEVTA
jgi:heavy metal sensor kinase